jgi:hypothetical protein
MNIPALELSLKAVDLLLPRAELLQRLVEETSIKSWLFHPDERSAVADLFKARHRMVADAATRALNSCVDSAAKSFQPRRLSSPGWRRDNDWAEQVFRKRGRYPTLEETQAFARNKRRR